MLLMCTAQDSLTVAIVVRICSEADLGNDNQLAKVSFVPKLIGEGTFAEVCSTCSVLLCCCALQCDLS